MMKRILKNGAFFLYFFVLTLIIFGVKWAFSRFAFINFDEVLFQLTSSISTSESSVLSSLFIDCILPAFISALFLFIFFTITLAFLNNNDKVRKIRTKKIKNIMKVCLGICLLVVICYALTKITFWDYLKSISTKSNYIENNYVNPKNVKLSFPEKKRNLIIIYVESFESSFFSTELGGAAPENWIEPLQELTEDNTNFSDNEKFGGAKSVPGTTWTSGALVAQSSGLPLKVRNPLSLKKVEKGMIPNAYTLTDILNAEGYNQEFMIGSSKVFGQRGDYYENHGNVFVYDYDTAKEKKKIAKDYYEWWGFEDSKLFSFAKDEITNLSLKEEPFNFMLLTANSHTLDGYLEKECKEKFSNDYANSLYCTSLQIAQFVDWLEKQPFYDNTTIVIAGDHISMQPNLLENDSPRRVYNLYINEPLIAKSIKNREFSTMDLFPTTLASIGVEIEGERLGLGTNLYSDKKTLMEEIGYKEFIKQTYKNSSYYWEEFY